MLPQANLFPNRDTISSSLPGGPGHRGETQESLQAQVEHPEDCCVGCKVSSFVDALCASTDPDERKLGSRFAAAVVKVSFDIREEGRVAKFDPC